MGAEEVLGGFAELRVFGPRKLSNPQDASPQGPRLIERVADRSIDRPDDLPLDADTGGQSEIGGVQRCPVDAGRYQRVDGIDAPNRGHRISRVITHQFARGLQPRFSGDHRRRGRHLSDAWTGRCTGVPPSAAPSASPPAFLSAAPDRVDRPPHLVDRPRPADGGQSPRFDPCHPRLHPRPVRPPRQHLGHPPKRLTGRRRVADRQPALRRRQRRLGRRQRVTTSGRTGDLRALRRHRRRSLRGRPPGGDRQRRPDQLGLSEGGRRVGHLQRRSDRGRRILAAGRLPHQRRPHRDGGQRVSPAAGRLGDLFHRLCVPEDGVIQGPANAPDHRFDGRVRQFGGVTDPIQSGGRLRHGGHQRSPQRPQTDARPRRHAEDFHQVHRSGVERFDRPAADQRGFGHLPAAGEHDPIADRDQPNRSGRGPQPLRRVRRRGTDERGLPIRSTQ